MLLKELSKDIHRNHLTSKEEGFEILSLSCDSRSDQPQGMFIALDGFKVKGEDYIKEAIHRGAIAIVKKGSSRKVGEYTISESICVLDVEDPKKALKTLTQRFFGHPSKKVRTIGVTGTNGKTTVTYLLESILKANNQSSAVIGTINYRIAGQIFPSKNTTPGLLENQSNLSKLAASGIPYCVMEVSSHALEQGRVDGIEFASAVFTNLTQDHLDYHKDMESYFQAKAILFHSISSEASAIINRDDAYGQRLIQTSQGTILTYGFKGDADVKAVNVQISLKGLEMDVIFPRGQVHLTSQFIGEHNVYNILAACACAHYEGVSYDKIREGIKSLTCVPGRLEIVDGPQDFSVFIDYAHTPDGLINVLHALRKVTPNRIILVVGCGGDRDRTKRPLMGKAATDLADYSIITSDNPRSEEPQMIINDIVEGITKSNYEIIVDRKEAIAHALAMAKTGEVVLIAGKGHENYQIFKDRTIEFDEHSIVTRLLRGKQCLA